MTSIFRQNFALAMGILLPLALIAVFFLAGKASMESVPDPQYDAVFVTPRWTSNHYRIGVDDGKLYIRVRPVKEGAKPRPNRQPAIYVFDHRTKYAKKIAIDFENVVDGKVSDPELDALNRKSINPDALSPDGYIFERNQRGGRGFFAGMFGGGRHNRSYYVLRKGARSVPVVGPVAIYNSEFIGWVMK